MVGWTLRFAPRAEKDAKKLEAANLLEKAQNLLKIILEDPSKYPPQFEKLLGDLKGLFSRRINKKHRLVYDVRPLEQVIIVHSMFGHY